MRGFYGILLGSLLITAACDDDPTEPRIHASASVDQSSYTPSDTIRLTLTNTSDDETLLVLVCEYGEFPLVVVDRRVDGEWEVFNSTGCLGPSVIGIDLAPGEALTREIEVFVISAEPGTYRIGFYAFPPDRVPDDFADIDPVYTGSITVQ